MLLTRSFLIGTALLAASILFVLLGATRAHSPPPCVDEVGVALSLTAVTTTSLDLYEMFRKHYDDLTVDAWLDTHEAFIIHAEADTEFHRQVLELLKCAWPEA